MANGDPIPAGDLVFRRYDPENSGHWTADEGGGPGRLRSGNLKFDPEPETEPVRMGCSTYQSSKLVALKLVPGDCLHMTSWHIASIDPQTVREIDRPTLPHSPRPFDAVEFELDPAQDGDHLRARAHASITHALDLGAVDKWYRELATRFRPLGAVPASPSIGAPHDSSRAAPDPIGSTADVSAKEDL